MAVVSHSTELLRQVKRLHTPCLLTSDLGFVQADKKQLEASVKEKEELSASLAKLTEDNKVMVTEQDKLNMEKQTLETNCRVLSEERDKLLTEKEAALSKQGSSEEQFQLVQKERESLQQEVDKVRY